jgi:DnaJ-class molecular chaperone
VEEGKLRALVESWLAILDQSNYYELLGILEIADEAAIQQAFHRFSQSFHPDNHRNSPSDVREGVTRIFRRGAEAYRVLRDGKTRAAYDLALAQGALRYFRIGGSPDGQGTERGLEALCQTPGGRLHARKAERALSEGNFEEARAEMHHAQTAEGISIALENRFRELLELATSGRPQT